MKTLSHVKALVDSVGGVLLRVTHPSIRRSSTDCGCLCSKAFGPYLQVGLVPSVDRQPIRKLVASVVDNLSGLGRVRPKAGWSNTDTAVCLLCGESRDKELRWQQLDLLAHPLASRAFGHGAFRTASL